MTTHLTQRARELRRNMTDAERKLWRHLRNRQVLNLKFRRQQPIGMFIVDFVCFENKLIIEVDGGQHADEQEKDKRRTAWLNRNGFHVIRFWNNDVLRNIEGVLQRVLEVCENPALTPA